MKRFLIICVAVLAFSLCSSAQRLALKNNFLYDATLTPNLSAELALGRKVTVDLGYGYNPFRKGQEVNWRHWLVQPEVRLWTCESFNGFFVGLHGHGGEYNISGMNIPFILQPHEDMAKHRYEGYLYGGGLSLGYQWMLSKRLNLEASVGAGYARAHYNKFDCGECGIRRDAAIADYVGITKATLSLVWLIAL